MQENGMILYYPYEKEYSLFKLSGGTYKHYASAKTLQAILQKAIVAGIVYSAKIINCY